MKQENYVELIVRDLTIAQKFGFQWPNYSMILKQVKNECEEVRKAIEENESIERIQEEVGDILHAAFSLCCFLELDVQETLKTSAIKFQKRFGKVQKITQAKGLDVLKDVSIETLREIWAEVKTSIEKE